MASSARLQPGAHSRSARLPPSPEASADRRSLGGGGQAGLSTGFTLTQLVLALAGLLFASLVVPSWLAVRVNSGRVARAEREVAAIAAAIERFTRDNGFLPAWTRAAGGGPGSEADRVDLLVGPGAMPQIADEAGPGWRSARTDSLDHQLVDNAPGYVQPRSAPDRGWRGPYLQPPTEDPWGNRYLAGVGFAAGSASPADHPGGAWVVSAGPNGVLESPCVAVKEPSRPCADDVGALLELMNAGTALHRGSHGS